MSNAPDYKSNDPKGWCGDPKRGAAMGRPTIKTAPLTTGRRVYLRRVRLNSGGYDCNGTYFGTGGRLYWCADSEGEIDFMVRAMDRADAKRKVRIDYPNVTFYGGSWNDRR